MNDVLPFPLQSTNFANQLYDVYNPAQSESTQMLLGSGNAEEERNELIDDNSTVRYFGSNQPSDSNKFSHA